MKLFKKFFINVIRDGTRIVVARLDSTIVCKKTEIALSWSKIEWTHKYDSVAGN